MICLRIRRSSTTLNSPKITFSSNKDFEITFCSEIQEQSNLSERFCYITMIDSMGTVIDSMATGRHQECRVKERVDKYRYPEHSKFLCTTTVNDKVWDQLSGGSRTFDFQMVQEVLFHGLSSLSILGDQFVRDIQTDKTANICPVLD